MADEVTIRVRDNGPLIIEGPASIIDADGAPFPRNPEKPAVAICRCGQSENMPFCDGHHKTCGFQSVERAPSS